MVPSMGTMERLYSPKINNVAVVFNFNTIFYVRSRSEEISPTGGWIFFINFSIKSRFQEGQKKYDKVVWLLYFFINSDVIIWQGNK